MNALTELTAAAEELISAVENAPVWGTDSKAFPLKSSRRKRVSAALALCREKVKSAKGNTK